MKQITVAVRSKAKVCGRFPAEIVGSNPVATCVTGYGLDGDVVNHYTQRMVRRSGHGSA